MIMVHHLWRQSIWLKKLDNLMQVFFVSCLSVVESMIFFLFLNCITSLAIVVWLHCAMSPLGFFFEIVFPTIFLALPHRCLYCVLVSLLVTFLNCLLVNLKAKVLLFHNFHSFIFSRLDKHA